MKKILTVSVAAYNVEKYLKKALDSCICEEMKFLEVLIIDDGSKDKTSEVAKEYELRYPGIFRCISKENGGYGSTINTAVRCAIGKYFKLLDGDDWYNTDELNKLLLKLKECNADMVVTDYSEVYEISNKKRLCRFGDFVCDQELSFSNECIELDVPMHAVIYKTELFLQNFIMITEHCFYTDSEFLLTPIPYVRTIEFYHLDVYQYRLAVAGQSVSIEGMRKHYKDAYKVLDKLLPLLENVSDKNVESFLVKNLSKIADFQLRAFLCMKPNKKMKEELVNYDKKLERVEKRVYSGMENFMTKLLRKTDYKIYYIYSNYIIFRMWIINKLRKG